jgi:hypothetical protein
MTDAAATFYDVPSFDGRILLLGACRRLARFLGGSLVVGLGAVAAAGALIVTVTMAAAWIVNAAVATNPSLHAKARFDLAAGPLAADMPRLASATDVGGVAQASAAPVAAPTFEAEWDRRTAATSARMSAAPSMPQRPVEHAAPPKQLAELTPAASATSAQPGTAARPPVHAVERINAAPLPLPLPLPHEVPHDKPRETAKVPVPPVAPAGAAKRVAVLPDQNKPAPLPDRDKRTAVYDIAAHTVYLPDGERLEAHSGLGNKLDDPRFVNVRDRGPTPPNVYDLTLREQLFHEVRAIRLNPVGDGNMFGRDGMLAHPYMLGTNGQSNGCVSFKDYPAFLRAYLAGKVDRLVVVSRLGNASWRSVSAHLAPARRYADNAP